MVTTLRGIHPRRYKWFLELPPYPPAPNQTQQDKTIMFHRYFAFAVKIIAVFSWSRYCLSIFLPRHTQQTHALKNKLFDNKAIAFIGELSRQDFLRSIHRHLFVWLCLIDWLIDWLFVCLFDWLIETSEKSPTILEEVTGLVKHPHIVVIKCHCRKINAQESRHPRTKEKRKTTSLWPR